MTNNKATTALILGIIAFFIGWIPIIGWTIVILAIVYGVKGIKTAKELPEKEGEGNAIAGIILGAIGIISGLFLVMIGTILYFGALNPTLTLPTRCLVSAEFTCDDYIIERTNTGATLQMILTNNLGTSITFSQPAGTAGINCVGECIDATGTCIATPATVGAGQTTDITCTIEGNIHDQKNKVSVTLNYTPVGKLNKITTRAEVYANVQ